MKYIWWWEFAHNRVLNLTFLFYAASKMWSNACRLMFFYRVPSEFGRISVIQIKITYKCNFWMFSWYKISSFSLVYSFIVCFFSASFLISFPFPSLAFSNFLSCCIVRFALYLLLPQDFMFIIFRFALLPELSFLLIQFQSFVMNFTFARIFWILSSARFSPRDLEKP